MNIGLDHFLVVSALLFCIGLYGVLTKRNAVAILMGIELMLNAVNINLVAFNRFVAPADFIGQLFAVFIIVVAAAEVAVGLALVICIYRIRDSVHVDDLDLLKW
jgi:NADH-quinone oxidoreductase subunit K